MTNAERAQRADAAVQTHAIAGGSVEEDVGLQLKDLLTDLRHFAEAAGLDFETIDAQAAGMYVEEREEDE